MICDNVEVQFHDASQRSSRPPAALSNDWATEFDAHPGQDWANQFDQAQAQAETSARDRLAAEQDSMDQTRALAATMASSNDPKFKQSKFLQFVSKMSRGEIILENNQVRLRSIQPHSDVHPCSTDTIRACQICRFATKPQGCVILLASPSV